MEINKQTSKTTLHSIIKTVKTSINVETFRRRNVFRSNRRVNVREAIVVGPPSTFHTSNITVHS